MPFGRKSSRFSRQKYTLFPKTPRSARKPAKSSYSGRKTRKSAAAGFAGLSFKNLNLDSIKGFFKYLFTTKEGLTRLGFATLVGLGIISALFVWYAKDLPSPDKINARVSAQSTQIFDRNGKLLYEIHGDKNRILADFGEFPDSLKHATIAVEDKNFYSHGSFDVFGIGRAMVGVVFRDSSKGGGSTITQQFVKNALLTNEYSFTRKIKEIILATEIEQMYKKDDILKMYLNEIPYGSNAYGAKVAARTFFNKDLKDLTLAESATMAALPNAPTYYSPFGNHRDALMERKNMILDLMVEQKYVTRAQADAAKKETLTFSNNPYGSIMAPHWVMYVKEQLVNKYGEKMVDEGGLKVYTSLDMTLQKYAEEAVATNVDQNRGRYQASNASLVAADPKTGQILAMVGSRDYFDENIDGNVNVSIMSRQPGSSFKPFAYATAWKLPNWGPGSVLYDVRTDFGGGYVPQNYSGGFWGPVTMRIALQNSLNIPAVKTLYIAGLDDTLATAHAMGISTLNDPSQYGLSLVLGAGEVKLVDMVGAYGVFADNGVKQDQTWFVRIEDSKGKVLDEYKNRQGKTVLDPQVAYLMNNVLSDDPSRAQTFGAGSDLTLSGRPAAAKTGTTNSYKDAWTLGYTPSLVAGVWAGNNDGTPMTSAGGAIAAAPIWHDFMAKALAGTPVEEFNRPSGIKTVTVSNPGKTSTDIFPSWYKPNLAGSGSTEIKINKLTDKQVNDACPPDAANIQVKTVGVVTAEISPNDGAYSRWFAPIQAWAIGAGLTADTANTPKDVCVVKTAAPIIEILSPADGSSVSGSFDVAVKATAAGGVSSVKVTMDGQTITASKSGSTYVATFNGITPGNQTITAVVKDSKGQSATAKITVTAL